MDATRDYLAWLADSEFGGGSFNGPSLIETLRSISAEEALSTDTYEGYTAWGVALHVLYFKYLVGKQLGAELPEYHYDEKGWPAIGDDRSQSAYESMIEELEAFHNPTVTAFKTASDEQLSAEMPGWERPLGIAFAWIVSHDTNHNTQIRNMGLPSLKMK